ncbi:MAG: hypothetical protein L0221_13000 [Chloroflexi bacterium]|nr:hypothetical protein [Chloroflexota bacterium]
MCLADFVAPKSSGVRDWIGAFAVSAGGIEARVASPAKSRCPDHLGVPVEACPVAGTGRGDRRDLESWWTSAPIAGSVIAGRCDILLPDRTSVPGGCEEGRAPRRAGVTARSRGPAGAARALRPWGEVRQAWPG